MMRRLDPKRWIPSALGVLAASCAGAPRIPPGEHAEAFRKAIVVDVRMRYLLFLPREYESRSSWPLVLFLHGSGERGDDLEAVKRNGPPKLARMRDFPFILVSPQCPSNEPWDTRALLALLDDLTPKLRVDPGRVYATGLSTGGYATWALALAAPERFAAIAPVSGGGDPEAACVLKGVPVWAFHGEDDPVVPVEEDREMVEALRACGGDGKLTVYPGVGHDAWTQTYDDPALYEWLLAHRRVAPGARR